MLDQTPLCPILQTLLQQRSLAVKEWEALEALEQLDSGRMAAFNISSANVQVVIRQRVDILQQVYPAFCDWCSSCLGEPNTYLATLWWLWLPLAMDLVNRQRALNRPLIQGVLGGQGTGKTTLGAVLKIILRKLGYNALSWSLDDLYKTYRDRVQLQHQEPQLIWRGPPGTHDVNLGIQVLDQLRSATPGQPISIPRFDKSLHGGMGDRVAPEWVKNVDIVLFEGWFVGIHPIDAIAFQEPPAPILSQADLNFARTCNTRLQDYLPLWQRLDSLWVLYPSDYRLSLEWRKQAEHRMKATGKSGMTDSEIEAFVTYFWKALHPELFIPAALQSADLAIAINSDHSPERVYKSGTYGIQNPSKNWKDSVETNPNSLE
ncbi:putative kinase [Leptolyngbyaceae cyanobacterium JSC-12]|nr:putative kinase [Leptolyngbyaceae cyanobacterium JSC-12]